LPGVIRLVNHYYNFPTANAPKACLQAAQNLAELHIACSDFSTLYGILEGAAILPFAQLDRVHHVTTCKRTQVACRNFLK